ncbi:hypothetical protein N9N32_00215 [Alphaproteobacteria bacterium]|nr:hypothetical protein [Alphaproteobacteria bacterium]
MDIIYILTAFILTPVAEVHELAAFGTLYECEVVLAEAKEMLLDTVDADLTCEEVSTDVEG